MTSAHILERKFSQDLTVGSLSQEYEFIEQSRVVAVYLHFTEDITETVTVTRISRHSDEYNVMANRKVLDDVSDYIFHPEWHLMLTKGDKIRVECTNANELGTVYGIIHIEGGVK